MVGPTPEIVHAVFLFVLADRRYDIAEEFPEMLRHLPDFGCVFREILKHGLEIDQWSPVDVTDIHEQQVLFEIVD